MAEPLIAHYDPPAMRVPLAGSVVLVVAGVGSAVAGVWFGWILAAFFAWTAVNARRRMHRPDPVLVLDPEGVRDVRTGMRVAWPQVESMRTVNRRVVGRVVPLLEIVPTTVERRGAVMQAAAVLRGDMAFVDARDRKRLIFDLRHLDVTPEQVLAAARELRAA